MNQTAKKSPLGLRLIGGFKLVSGLLMVGVGIGLFRSVNKDIGEQMHRLTSALNVDPDSHYIHQLIEKVSQISPKQLRAISFGTFLYALMYLVEGTGLLLKKHWAEYLTVVATGLFIPLEIYEVVMHPTAIRIGVLVINVAIVAYLVYQLRNKERGG